MINILIWSKNRPAQLDALLWSLDTYIEPKEVVVLYKADKEYEQAYNWVRLNHEALNDGDEDKIGFSHFVEEKDFYADTLDIVSSFSGNVCFSTDDTIVFNNVENLEYAVHTVESPLQNTVFSFRLGYNTIVQDHIQRYNQPALKPDYITRGFLMWQPSKYNGYNYGYPHALDMHLYSTDYILPILKEIKFSNSNVLEGILQKYNSRVDWLMSPKESVAVNVPLNNISGLTGVNQKNNMTMQELNKAFLDGKTLTYVFDKKPEGCHEDIKFILED